MADPKSAKSAPTQAEQNAEAAEQHSEATSMAQDRYVVIAKLRRDTMILATGTDTDELAALASSAVREGRASEVFIVKAFGYFSESEIDFIPRPAAVETRYADQSADRVPLLNPSTGEQSLDVAAACKPTPPTAEVPTHGSAGQGDGNKGAGAGTTQGDPDKK